MPQHSKIYKITTAALWAKGQAEGVLPPSPIDAKDGFMHFSSASQLVETLRLHFAGQDQLILAEIDPKRVAENLKWEPSRGGALFPHLYAPLPMSAIIAHHPIAVASDGTTTLPTGIA